MTRPIIATLSLVLLVGLLTSTPAPAQDPAPEPQDANLPWLVHSTDALTHDAFVNAEPPTYGPPIATSPVADTALDPAGLASALQPDPNGIHSIESHPSLPFTLATVPSENLVLVIASIPGEVTAELSIRNEPSAMAFSPDGEFVYFISRTNNFLRKFAIGHFLVTGEELPTTKVQLSVSPVDLVVGAGGTIYVLGVNDFWPYLISVDPVTKQETRLYVAGASFYWGELEINREGTRLYFGDHGLSPSSLLVIDLTVDPPVLVVETPHGPAGSNGQDLELSLDGEFIAYPTGSGQANYKIAKYSTTDLSIEGYWNTGAYPHAVGLSPDGELAYTANTDSVVDVWEGSAPFSKLGSWSVNGEAVEIHAPPYGSLVFVLLDTGFAAVLESNHERQGVLRCSGLPVTVDMNLGQVATDGIDVILGTPGNDVINSGDGSIDLTCGGAGDDRYFGGAGEDIFYGEDGNDRALGYDGKDILIGGAGTDYLSGGSGDDILDGGDGVDRLEGGADADLILGLGGSDRLHGGSGDDIIEGGSGADRIWGGAGNDVINGMGGRDRIDGQSGDDVIQGSHQSDDIAGGTGNDILRGAKGKDYLYGNDGNDELYGGDNSDYLHGGRGADYHNGQRGSDDCERSGSAPSDQFVSC